MRYVVRPGFVWIVMVGSVCGGKNLWANQPDSLESLRKMKLEAAQEWCAALAAREEDGAGNVALGELFQAAKALKAAQLDVATSKPERVRALEAYRDRMQLLSERIEALFQSGRRGGEVEHRAQARFHLLEAKILLKQEAGKP